jgi:hypothetical protein
MSYFFETPSDHPDAIELEIAGQSFHWLLNKSAFEQGKEEGVDFSQFRELEEDDVEGNLDALASLLYVGTLPFDAPIEKADFDAVLTPRLAAELGPKVMAQFEGLTDEELPEEVTAGK